MRKIFLIIIVLSLQSVYTQPKFSSINSMPGAFSRMGFGARGIGMGNAMSSVIEGNLNSYYNPAAVVYQQDNLLQTSYSFLSLDRSLNFLNFTRKFDLYSTRDTSLQRKPTSSAGVSIGIINSGVGKIDGRDNQGVRTGDLSTSENQFFLGLAKTFSDKLSIGIAIKFYYYKLYEEISSSGLGVDIGGVFRINDEFNVSLVITDINSKYKWDSTPIYGQDGASTENKFPGLRKIGAAYSNKELGLLASLELENSSAQSNILRAGIEYKLMEQLYIRGGLDQFNLSNSDQPAKPAFGISFLQNFGRWNLCIDYAFMIEQYSPQDRNIIGVNILF